ncbi:hypothetical protein [Ancylobacter lacus]|uniref:hypothetical protein n=1 Tax=Ancylobacter lacus TaxID=2579970 RepID=UPI001BCD900C|nr:hypothetical protein [Ancylobacter lacus]MBS7540887.1 hypothetical protein [Ancylobacter lacus]
MPILTAVSLAVLSALAGPAAAAGFDGASAGTGATDGGTKPFCKGTFKVKATVKGEANAVTVPVADGGSVTLSGKVAANGAFSPTDGRFTHSGTISGKALIGKWRGPSCYGTLSLSR